MLKFALLFAVLFQMGAAVQALSLIRRTRFNVSWILISSGFVLMALRRLFDFSALFWESKFFPKEEVNSWIGVLISVLMFEKDRALIVFYQDDGSGFDAGEYLGLAIRSGMGLDNIVSRVKSLKGKYVIDSAPNKGFSFQLTIPAE